MGFGASDALGAEHPGHPENAFEPNVQPKVQPNVQYESKQGSNVQLSSRVLSKRAPSKDIFEPAEHWNPACSRTEHWAERWAAHWVQPDVQ